SHIKVCIFRESIMGADIDRYYCFGKIDNTVVTMRFVYRNSKIRIIGAGYWRKGKQIYEKENKI
ncbi:MAG: BrnT family toxin, partial [Ignavibacteriales bacterium]|nr:BrnT family toxin [Ignavibacteriales bacterium]